MKQSINLLESGTRSRKCGSGKYGSSQVEVRMITMYSRKQAPCPLTCEAHLHEFTSTIATMKPLFHQSICRTVRLLECWGPEYLHVLLKVTSQTTLNAKEVTLGTLRLFDLSFDGIHRIIPLPPHVFELCLHGLCLQVLKCALPRVLSVLPPTD